MFIPPDNLKTKVAGVTMCDHKLRPGEPIPRQQYLAAIKNLKNQKNIPYSKIPCYLRAAGWNWECSRCCQWWPEYDPKSGQVLLAREEGGFSCPNCGQALAACSANPHDPDALEVLAKVQTGPVKLGFIQNRRRVCTNINCGEECTPDKGSSSPLECCPKCGSALTRNGLASELREAMRQGFTFDVTICEITGGDGVGKDGTPKNMGCNIKLKRIDPR